jgi:hypothetical protein
MRRLLVTLALVGALAAPLSVHAGTTVQKVPFDSTFAICNGDLVHISGTLLFTQTLTTTPSGGTIIAFHFQPQGLSGVDLSTGTMYIGTGLTRDVIVNSPPGGTTETFVNRFHIQATKGAQSFEVIETAHITVAPDGTVKVVFDNFSSTCPLT